MNPSALIRIAIAACFVIALAAGFSACNPPKNHKPPINTGTGSDTGTGTGTGTDTGTGTGTGTGSGPLPSQPSNPIPADASVNISTGTTLAWDVCDCATSYDVYFGTTTTPPLRVNVTSPSVLNAQLPTLAFTTQYYWYVVAKNGAGTTQGDLWSFTTRANDVPSTPANPNPANNATGVLLTTNLSWGACDNANSYDVYFGTPMAVFITNVAGPTVSNAQLSGPLAMSTTYTWYIVAKNTYGDTTGPTWRFMTKGPDLPAAPAGPTPANGAANIAVTTDISWNASQYATGYDVYFGVSPSLVASNTSSTTVLNAALGGPLLYETTYSWYVVAKNQYGDTTSATWTFKTAFTPLAAPSNPQPDNGATNVPVDTDLAWSNVPRAQDYYVFFGTTPDPPYKDQTFSSSNSIANSFIGGPLTAGTTYYWKVVATDFLENASSPVWYFVTEPPFTMTWTNKTTSYRPSGRYNAAMAWDGSQLVLFGGIFFSGNTGYYADNIPTTWKWNGSAWSCDNVSAQPANRAGTSMCYDGQGALLFGGVGSVFMNDLWRCVNGVWTQLSPAGGPPPARVYHRMTYDASRNVCIIFGGMSTGSIYLYDTWEYHLANNSWIEKFPSSSPAARSSFGLAYVGTDVLLHGGRDTMYAYGDTYKYTGATWETVGLNPNPGFAYYSSLVATETFSYGVLWVGANTSGFTNIAWMYDGAAWKNIQYTNPATGPGPRGNVAMAWDYARDEFVIFGGYDGSNNRYETYALKEN
jgi:hypothetical protein